MLCQWAGTGKEDADAAHAAFEGFSGPIPVTGAVNLSLVYRHLAEALPPDAIVCNGAGNYAAWLHRFYRHRRPATQLGPTSGAMGFGLPAAIAAKLEFPEREAVAVAGDGCFLMTGQELATAVQYKANVLAMVIDNGSLATIRMHQEREYPGHVVGTRLANPGFRRVCAVVRSLGRAGRAYGGFSRRVGGSARPERRCTAASEDFAARHRAGADVARLAQRTRSPNGPSHGCA